MTANRSTSSKHNDDNDTATPLAFYFFVGALALSVLGALWVLFQMTFL